MQKRMACRILCTLIFTFVFTSIAAAHEVRISEKAKIGDFSELAEGTYRVEVEKNKHSVEVLFYQGRELVTTAPAILAKEASKCSSTEIHSEEIDGGRVITKIRLQGSNESLVFKLDTPETE